MDFPQPNILFPSQMWTTMRCQTQSWQLSYNRTRSRYPPWFGLKKHKFITNIPITNLELLTWTSWSDGRDEFKSLFSGSCSPRVKRKSSRCSNWPRLVLVMTIIFLALVILIMNTFIIWKFYSSSSWKPSSSFFSSSNTDVPHHSCMLKNK